MDFSFEGIEKREEELRSPGRRVKTHIAAVLIRVGFLAFLAACVIFVCGAFEIWRGIIEKAPDVDSINISPAGFATYIYDARGNQLQKLTTTDSNRTAVSLRMVPEDLQHAVVAIEDERFYKHNGIDPGSILRALFTAVTHGFRSTQGASTITQQLLKNNVFTGWTEEKTLREKIERKLAEQYLAVRLEEKLQDKDLILENYLNTVNMGAGTYGVQSAARTYFDKDVHELNLSECAVIAGITQNRVRYNPIRHPEENAGRRQRVLKKMLELGYITPEEMDAALADPVYERIKAAQEARSLEGSVYSWFVDELTLQVVRDLMRQKGYTEMQAYQLLYSGGLRIYTTQDRDIQAVCDEEYGNPDNFPEKTEYMLDWAMTVRQPDGKVRNYSVEMLRNYFREQEDGSGDSGFSLLFSRKEDAEACVDTYRKAVLTAGDELVAERLQLVPEPQSSLVVMDQQTGYVKALTGGRGEKNASLVLNRATGTYRQPGSTFKILSTYAPALDSGAKTIGSYVEDAPYQYENGTQVHNADGEYHGWITLRQAIADSNNVAAVRLLTQITPARGYQQLLKFGITSLDPSRDVVQPLALGGISGGVSNLELTAAYAAIANGGIYTKPVLYTKILNQNGEVVIDNTPETGRAVSEDTAFILTDAMEDVVRYGTGTEAALESGMPVAGKTGTTSGYNDVWFVGYTPYYTMGIWAGYDSGARLGEEGTYREFHKTLWKRIMERISAGQEIRAFVKPEGVSKMKTCGLTGLLPSKNCQHVSRDYVSAAFKPNAVCPHCVNEKAEVFDESDWKKFTEELISEHGYEEIPEEEFKAFVTETPAPAHRDRSGELFEIVTEDEGTFTEENLDEFGFAYEDSGTFRSENSGRQEDGDYYGDRDYEDGDYIPIGDDEYGYDEYADDEYADEEYTEFDEDEVFG